MSLALLSRVMFPLFFGRLLIPILIFLMGYMFKGNEAYVSEKIGYAVNNMIKEIKQGVDSSNRKQDPIEEKLKVMKERLDAQIKLDRERMKEEG
jgi:hypothetical protein